MRSIDYSKNLIDTAGNYDPFVYRDVDGIHVGDCDNHQVFLTVAEALVYANGYTLCGGDLATAAYHADIDARDNYAAEHSWHEDALLQIAAIKSL